MTIAVDILVTKYCFISHKQLRCVKDSKTFGTLALSDGCVGVARRRQENIHSDRPAFYHSSHSVSLLYVAQRFWGVNAKRRCAEENDRSRRPRVPSSRRQRIRSSSM